MVAYLITRLPLPALLRATPAAAQTRMAHRPLEFDDGPEINSARQLWSVGGYLGAVTGTLFGWHPEADGVRVAPFLTTHARSLMGDIARVSGLSFAGKTVDIALTLPPRAKDGGWYPVRSIRLNGRSVPVRITAAALRDGANLVEITFASPRRSPARVTEAPRVPPLGHDDPRAFMTATPMVEVTGGDIGIASGSTDLSYTIRQDGRVIARDKGVFWTTRRRNRDATACFTAVAVRPGGLPSQPSARACDPGVASRRITMADPRVTSDAPLLPPSGGVAAQTRPLNMAKALTVRDIRIDRAGLYAVSLDYDNHVFQLNTGVTNAVKRLTLTPASGAAESAVIQMPHTRPVEAARRGGYEQRPGDTYPLRRSTRAYLRLKPGTYTLTLTDFLNMSTLTTNASYSNPGGEAGPVNEARVAAVMVDLVE